MVDKENYQEPEDHFVEGHPLQMGHQALMGSANCQVVVGYMDDYHRVHTDSSR